VGPNANPGLRGTVYLKGVEVGSGPFDGTLLTTGAEGLGVGGSAGAPWGAGRYAGLLEELAIWALRQAPFRMPVDRPKTFCANPRGPLNWANRRAAS